MWHVVCGEIVDLNGSITHDLPHEQVMVKVVLLTFFLLICLGSCFIVTTMLKAFFLDD